jgi:hypothetical protein
MAVDIKPIFTELATDDRLIQQTSEIIKSKVLYEEASELFTIVPGIKGGQQVAAAKTPEYITRASQGCGGNALNPNMPAISQKWNPKLAEVKIKYCYTDFMGFFTQWGLKNGYAVKDLSDTEFMKFIYDFTAEAVKADMLRIALLADEDISTQSILTDPAKAEFYNVIPKGLIPTLQYFSTVGALEDNFIELAANAQGDPYNLANGYSKDLFRQLTRDIAFAQGQILTNSKLYQNYEDYFEDLAGVGVESSITRIQNGQARLSRSGSPIVHSQGFDRWRINDFVSTEPAHFAIHTDKTNLQIGVDDERSLTDLTFEYMGGDDEHFYIKANYMMDFKIPNPFDFKAAI